MITYPTSTRLGRALLVFSGSSALGVARAQYQAGSSSEAMTTDAETDPYCRVGGSTRVDSGDGQKYHVGPSFRNLISNKVQPAGESPLTPTLSHEYAGEGADMLPLPLVGEGADMLPLPLVGEGAGILPLPLVGEGADMLPLPLVGEGADMLPLPLAGEGAGMLPLPLVGEGADMLPLPLVGEGAGMLPLPLAGEGWGEGGSSSQVPVAEAPCQSGSGKTKRPSTLSSSATPWPRATASARTAGRLGVLAAGLGHPGEPQHADEQAAMRRSSPLPAPPASPSTPLRRHRPTRSATRQWARTGAAVGSDLGVFRAHPPG